MNIWNKTEDNAFTRVKTLTEGLANHSSYSAIQKLTMIFNKLFQSYNQSLLSNLYEEVFKKKTSDSWKKTFCYAVELFAPDS